MADIHIRDVAPDTLQALKRLASSNQRSLAGELRAILDQAARMAPPEPGSRSLDLVTVKTGRATAWSRDEIYGTDGR